MHKRQITKLETLRLLDRKFHYKENVVKLNRGNTLEHELAKVMLCWEMLQNGDDVITEAIFENGKRADIINLQQGLAYEVTHSETKKSIKIKEEEYPIPIKVFKAKEVLDSWNINL